MKDGHPDFNGYWVAGTGGGQGGTEQFERDKDWPRFSTIFPSIREKNPFARRIPAKRPISLLTMPNGWPK